MKTLKKTLELIGLLVGWVFMAAMGFAIIILIYAAIIAVPVAIIFGGIYLIS